MQTNPESAAVESVAIDRYDLGPDGMYWDRTGDYVRYDDHQSALDALRGEVERLRSKVSYEFSERELATIQRDDAWEREAAHKQRADAAERRVAEIHGALRVALASIDETCKEMTLGDRFTNAGQSLIDALPVCRAALTKETP